MKAYTDLEQSKKLAEILPFESADMYYHYDFDFDKLESIPVITEEDDHFVLFPEDVRCWSLAALLNVIKESELIGSPEGTWLNRVWYNGFPFSRGGYNNPVDACVDMIIKLHERKML